MRGPDILKKMVALKQKDKFATSEWELRGLNPSDLRTVTKLTHTLNDLLDVLIEQLRTQQTDDELQKSLTKGLKSFKARDYDTEEREFIADYIHEISCILETDIGDEIDAWMYSGTS